MGAIINLPAEPVGRLIPHSRRGIEIFFFVVVLLVVVFVVIVIIITDVRSQPQLLKLWFNESGSNILIVVRKT